MFTDWLIIRRLAAELDELLRGRRITAAGALPGGRFGLGTSAGVVAFDAFGPLPLVTLHANAPLTVEPGFHRTAADALIGLRIDRVAARRGDRLIVFDCSARSRFGVGNGYRLAAELVPRYGNLVLLKGDRVVASAKSFHAGGATRRTVAAGLPYEAPPLPALGGTPRIPRMVAASLEIDRAGAAHRVRERVDAELSHDSVDLSQPVFAYRDGGRLVQVHTLPLLQYGALEEERAPRLLPLLAEALDANATGSAQSRIPVLRERLLARIARRAAGLVGERATLDDERAQIADRDRLRRAGDSLYAYGDLVQRGSKQFIVPGEPGHVIELDPRLSAKANAAAFFKRYKKAATSLAHLERRFERLAGEERLLDDLSWAVSEVEDDATLEDLARDVDLALNPRKTKRAATRTRRPALEVSIAPDAKILVGRSPRMNADLTFRVARPGDLWFHARNTPGAHVILRVDGAREASPAEIVRAAELAAAHSRSKSAVKVDVDYTERKHVRKQRGAAPGLVWYSDARTITVTPRDVESS